MGSEIVWELNLVWLTVWPQEHAGALGKGPAFSLLGVPKIIFAVKQLQ